MQSQGSIELSHVNEAGAGAEKSGHQKDSELFSIESTEPIGINVDGNDFMGKWDEMEWFELDRLACAQANLALKILNLQDDDIDQERIVRMYGGQARAILRVSIINPDRSLIRDERLRLDSSLQCFTEEINSGSDLFKKVGAMLDEQTYQAVEEEKNNFLMVNGGKKISVPIKVVLRENQIGCSGSYNPKPATSPAITTRKEVVGLVDEICYSNKLIKVVTDDKELKMIYFDLQYFFEELVEVFRFRQTHRFVVVDSADAKGKRTLTLEEIGEEIQLEGRLL